MSLCGVDRVVRVADDSESATFLDFRDKMCHKRADSFVIKSAL